MGIEEVIQLAGVFIYPVPATDQVNFRFDIGVAEKIVITVTDITGKTIIVKQLPNATVGTIQQLDLNGFAAGTYFYSIRAGEKTGKGKLMVTE